MKLYSLPEDVDIYHYYKNTFVLSIEMTNSNAEVFDLTGYTSVLAVRSTKDSTTNLFTINGTIDVDTGIIEFTKSNTEMAAILIGNYYWDLYLSDGTTVTYTIGGTLHQTSKTKKTSSSSLQVRFIADRILRISFGSNITAYPKTSFKFGEDLTGTKDGVNTTFLIPVTTGKTLVAGKLILIFNGMPLKKDTNYTISGHTVTMITWIPNTGDTLWGFWIEE
jgi:hypothetical protein